MKDFLNRLFTSRVNRRRFLRVALFGTPVTAFADSYWVEPNWLKLRKISFAKGKPTHRIVHFTDLHHKGDKEYLEKVVQEINGLSPDFVCMTGDIIEEDKYLTESLQILRGIKSPMYGVPGNHDYWAHADFDEIADAFSATGGAWLVDSHAITRDGKFTIHGAGERPPTHLQLDPHTKNIMLIHYPEWADKLPNKFDLILAGHTHGGQVRLPFYGPMIVPFGTGKYDLGLFQTNGGPLYVSSGIGWFFLNLRFLCRPEIVMFEI